MAVTVNDIAVRANVAGSTVSRVLNNRGKSFISEKTRERVLQVAREMEYRPSLLARSLRQGKSNLIGVLMDTKAPRYLGESLAIIEDFFSKAGYRVMVGHAHDDIESFKQYINVFASYGIDGIICMSHDYLGKEEEMSKLLLSFPNSVFLQKPGWGDSKDFGAVSRDTHFGYMQATKHLLDRGAKKISLVLDDLQSISSIERRCGYSEALKSHGIDANIENVITVSDFDGDWMKCANSLLEKETDAVLLGNDQMAMKLIRKFNLLKIKIPEQVAIIGCDNLDFGEFLTPSLTTISWKVRSISRQLAEMLLAKIENKEVSQASVVVKPELIVRESA